MSLFLCAAVSVMGAAGKGSVRGLRFIFASRAMRGHVMGIIFWFEFTDFELL